MPHLNVEIKARCKNPEAVEKFLKDKKALYKGLDHQVDTYFNVPNGRLKLREGNIENHLIHYFRENKEGPKQSFVTLYPSTPGSALKDLLTKANGIKVVVDKQRSIYFIENVKFHIDEVQHLGSFVEIEAIDIEGVIGEKALLEQCNFYMEALGIEEKDLVDRSYSDLLLEG